MLGSSPIVATLLGVVGILGVLLCGWTLYARYRLLKLIRGLPRDDSSMSSENQLQGLRGLRLRFVIAVIAAALGMIVADMVALDIVHTLGFTPPLLLDIVILVIVTVAYWLVFGTALHMGYQLGRERVLRGHL